MKYSGLALTALAILLLASVAGAGGKGVMIDMAYDPALPAVAVAGQITELTFRVYNPDNGELLKHKNIDVSIFRDGKLVYGSGPSHTHSGVLTLRKVFYEPGLYRVKAVGLGIAGKSDLGFEFPLEIMGLGTGVMAGVDIRLPDKVLASVSTDVELWIKKKADGVFLLHSDALVTILREGMVVFDGRLHTHTGKLTFKYSFPEEGRYKLLAQFSPTKNFAPIIYETVAGEVDFWVGKPAMTQVKD